MKTTMMKYLGKGVMTAMMGLVLGLACGDDGGDGGDDGGDGSCDAKVQGFTECTTFLTCQPGQHCDNITCESGCLSDVNCACNQVCDKEPGQNIGACVAADPKPTTTGGSGGGEYAETCEIVCDAILADAMCFDTGELQGCYDRCATVTEAQLKQFAACLEGSGMDCTKILACMDNLPS